MSFICKHPTKAAHSHDLVVEAKRCWGLIPGFPEPAPAPVVPVTPMATPRQIAYVGDLGGSRDDAAAMTRTDCSAYIDLLKKQGKPKEAPRVESVPDPRLAMIEGLIDMVPDGYYAVQADSGQEITFLRIKRPNPTRSKPNPPALKVQTQHGPNLKEAALVYGKRWYWRQSQNFVMDKLLLLCANHFDAAMRYSRELNKCCRCNTELTDDRSRHYGIGPECETKNGWGWVIDRVDDMNDGRSFEHLRSLGLINL